MKKIVYLVVTALLLAGFTACTEDFNKDVASPQSYPQQDEQSVDGFTFKLSDVLTAPVVLTQEDLDTSAVFKAVLTTATPELAEGAYLIFQLQLSATETFEVYVDIDSENLASESSATITAPDLNSAIYKFYGGKAEERTVYIRAYYSVVDGNTTVLMPNPVVLGPVKVTPVQNSIDVLYITGDVISGIPTWKNSVEDIGSGLQLMFADDPSVAVYTYTASFLNTGETGGSKFPAVAGDWGTAYGYTGGVFAANGADNVPPPTADGYYTLKVDLEAMTVEYIPYTESTATTYTSMGVIGPATPNEWDSDIDMVELTPHIWVISSISLTEGEIKIRANDEWAVSWGATTETDQDLPFGKGTSDNGKNIKIDSAGDYYIAFNDLTGNYIVIPITDLP